MTKGAAAQEAGRSGRACVLVLDMHRGRAGALARVLHLLGCDLPKTPLESEHKGRSGYGTSEPVSRLNDAILACAAPAGHDWQPLDRDWLKSRAAAEFRPWAITAAEHEFGGSSLFVLTDTRIARTLSFWLDVLTSAGIRPLIVVPVGHPADVAPSATTGDSQRSELAHLVWLRHLLEAETASRGIARIFALHDESLTNWRQFAVRAEKALDICWPCAPENAAPGMDVLLSGELRLLRETPAHATESRALPAWISDAAEIFGRWTSEGESRTDFATLDRIKAAFDEAGATFAPLFAAGIESGHLETLERKIKDVRAEAAEERARRQQAELQLSARFAEIAALTRILRGTETAWETRIVAALLRAPLWRLLPEFLRRRQRMALLKRSGDFDAEWYVNTYGDVAASGMDPLRHFVQHGARENRMPNPAAAGAWPDHRKADAG